MRGRRRCGGGFFFFRTGLCAPVRAGVVFVFEHLLDVVAASDGFVECAAFFAMLVGYIPGGGRGVGAFAPGSKRLAVAVVEDFAAFVGVTPVEVEQVAVVVVVADAVGELARRAVGVVRLVKVLRARHLCGEAAIEVDVHPALCLAAGEGLHAGDAAVFAVPDDFAVCGGGVEVVRVGVLDEDEGRRLRAVAVLVVVLGDEATIGGFAQRLAVVTAGAGAGDGGIVGVEVPGLAVFLRGVVEGGRARLSCI